MWDNLHKFAIVNIFVSILLAIHLYTKKIFKLTIIQFVFICVLLSIPATYDMVKNRMSTGLGNFIYPANEIQDVVTYLDGKNKTLIPYKIDIGGLCDATGYAAIAQYSGNVLKYSYFDNFLLSQKIESDTKLQIDWASSTSTTLVELSSEEGELFIIEKKYKDEFLNLIKINKNNLTNHHIVEFNNYLLY